MERSHCCCHLLRGAGSGISHLLCCQSGKVWHLHSVSERDWLCWVTLMNVARLSKPSVKLELWLYHDSPACTALMPGTETQARFPLLSLCVWVQHLTSAVAGCCLCCCSYLSLTMTYPSRVCWASSFLFSSRSNGTRRRSGGPQQPIIRVPHRQSLLPVRLRTPAPLYRNARWRFQPT